MKKIIESRLKAYKKHMRALEIEENKKNWPAYFNILQSSDYVKYFKISNFVESLDSIEENLHFIDISENIKMFLFSKIDIYHFNKFLANNFKVTQLMIFTNLLSENNFEMICDKLSSSLYLFELQITCSIIEFRENFLLSELQKNYFLNYIYIHEINSNYTYNSYSVITERNINLAQKFATKLLNIEKEKPVASNVKEFILQSPINLSLKSLNYFKYCDKSLLQNKFKNIDLKNISDTYLNPLFYQKNFFNLLGVCKQLQPNLKQKLSIAILPKCIIELIISYIPLEEYKIELPELQVASLGEELCDSLELYDL